MQSKNLKSPAFRAEGKHWHPLHLEQGDLYASTLKASLVGLQVGVRIGEMAAMGMHMVCT